MSLDFQNVDVKFTQGLDTKTQAKLVIPGKWNQLKNCALSEDETPTRRDGITSLVAAATGNGLATYNKELLVISGPTVKSISTGGVDQAAPVAGQYGFVTVAAKDIAFPGTDFGTQDSPDCATGGGYTCYVWVEPTNLAVRMSLLDEVTGAVLQSNVLVNLLAPVCPRVVYSSGAFFIFYMNPNGATSDLFCRVVLAATPTVLGPETAIITSAFLPNPPMNFDALETAANGVVVVYGWIDGTTSVRTIGVTQTAGVPGVLAGPSNIFTEAQLPIATLTGLCVASFSATAFGVFAASTGATSMAGMAGRPVNTSGIATGAAVQLNSSAAATTSFCHVTATRSGVANLQVFWDRQSEIAVPGMNPMRTMVVDSTMATVTAASVLVSSASFRVNAAEASGPTGPWICGKAFTTGGRPFLPACILETYASLNANTETSNEQNVFLLLDGLTGTVVARALYGTFGAVRVGTVPTVSTPCSTPEVSVGVFAFACTRRTVLEVFNGVANNTNTGICRLTLTPNSTLSPIASQLGQGTYVAGGGPSAYTPGDISELGFPLFPEGISAVTLAGGGSMTAGVHQVVAIYEWYDNAGHRRQSAPSLAVATTQVANDRITVHIPTLLVSQKPNVVVVLYMTQAAGLTFNRVASTPNDTTVAFVTIVVTSPDSLVAGNELLYTQPNTAGTTLPDLAPGPMTALAVAQNRIWFDKADSPGQFGFSQEYINNVGLQFNPQLGGTVDVSGGRIVGFATMDEKVIIFCTEKPFVVYGSGPNSAGGFSSYGAPQEVSSDVGCVDARSILKMPRGIIFKSEKGWYLLGRDLQVRYIGEGVAEFDGNSVSSAVLLKDRQECRFSSTSGTQLVYSYDANGGEWSTTVYRADSGAGVSDYAVADAVYWSTGGYYASVSTVHGTNRDTPGVFLDEPGGSLSLTIPITYRTSWLRMGIVNGFQRVQRMYLTGTAPERPRSLLNVTVSFDDGYGVVALGSYVFAADYSVIFPTFTVGSTVDINHHMQHQKCKAVAFTFLETPSLLQPAGVAFQAMSMKIGVKRGLRKLPAAQGT